MGQDTAWQSIESTGSWKTSLLEWKGSCSSAALGISQLLSTLEHPEERLLHQEAQNNRTLAQTPQETVAGIRILTSAVGMRIRADAG